MKLNVDLSELRISASKMLEGHLEIDSQLLKELIDISTELLELVNNLNQ